QVNAVEATPRCSRLSGQPPCSRRTAVWPPSCSVSSQATVVPGQQWGSIGKSFMHVQATRRPDSSASTRISSLVGPNPKTAIEPSLGSARLSPVQKEERPADVDRASKILSGAALTVVASVIADAMGRTSSVLVPVAGDGRQLIGLVAPDP